MRPFRRLFHSLYFRLLVIYGLTFLLVVFAIGIAFKISRDPDRQGTFWKNVQQYANYVVDDIGTPPDLDRARELGSQLDVDIFIAGPGTHFSTHEDLNKAHGKSCAFLTGPGANNEWRRCGRFREIRRGDYHFILGHRGKISSDRVPIGFAAGVTLVLLILLLSFRLVRGSLRPVREMQKVAKKYAEGEWSARLSTRREDELGQLALTMNEMADRIDRHFRSVRELLVAVSHELRSPLARMKVALEFVQDPKTRHSLNEEIDLLDELTGQLLEKERLDSRPEVLRKQPTELGSLLVEIAAPLGDRLKLLPGANPVLMVDRPRISICLRNILQNALKYSNGQVRARITESPGEIKVSVQDEGPGITAQDLPHIKEAFFRGEASRTGTRQDGGFGLGLSLCDSIMQAHGGEMEIKSREGQGTEVILVLRVKTDDLKP